jgi:RyR domain
MNAPYLPNPIDTSMVSLGPQLEGLVERLAENAHDVWSRQRIAEGWRFGPKRNDDQKEHPCLVPYGELPESEKEYDRTMAAATLKAITVLGYQIVPPGREGSG